ncbi:Putative transport protein [BD1-7 clade bacterium]|uniref:Transport protein n=1 Tax=BD1-7 clade bacterium TaxID=2029982 RepID=A0A5S9PVZ4_9GAMM|nr:Putative transport protein [BD1-7 clade bacterium]CAA0109553.1 Putative transport protein [BD1-7 clade bacterium]
MINARLYGFLAITAVVVILVISLQAILMPFLVAGFLAYLTDPVVDRLEARGVGRTWGVIIVFVILTAFMVLAVGLLLPLLARQLVSFIQQIPDYIEWVQGHLMPWIQQTFGINDAGVPVDELRQLLTENWQKAGGFARTLLQSATSSTLSIVTTLGNLVLIPVVFFYLLRDWDHMIAGIADTIPRAWVGQVTDLAKASNEVLSAFIRGQLMVMFTLGTIYSIGLSIVGLDLALFLGTLAGLFSVVPYLGTFVGIASATVAAYLQFHELMPVLYVGIVFGIGQMIESMVLTPLLVGDKVGLHPVVVIFAVMAGGQLAGFTGILLALPISAVLMVFVRHFLDKYKDSELYQHETNG